MGNIFQTAGVKVLKLGAHGEIKTLMPWGAGRKNLALRSGKKERESERVQERERTRGRRGEKKKSGLVISALRGNNHASLLILKQKPTKIEREREREGERERESDRMS